MTTQEIRTLCIEGTTAYLQFLEKNDRGVQRVPVLELHALHDDPEAEQRLYRLRLGGVLLDTEGINFRLKTNNKTYSTNALQVVSYDKQHRILLLRPLGDYQALLEGLTPKDLELVVDLKFLVKRVKTWYEKNGGAIALPQRRSPLHNSLNEILFFEDKRPSPNQQYALKTLFNAPLSYIWGAPGTGKTQGVLAYALLHYVRQGRKVAILAPTNNAIEQVLRGVLPMTDRAEVERNKVLRLGTPSKAYADAYPETCEARGILQQLTALEQQMDIFKKVLRYKKYDQLLEILAAGDGIFEALQQTKAALDSAVQTERGHLVRLNSNKRKIERRKKRLQTIHSDIRSIDRRTHLLDQKVTRAFAHELPKLKREREELRHEYRTIEDEIDDYEADNDLVQLDWEQAKVAVEVQQGALEQKIEGLRLHLPASIIQPLLDQILAGQVELVQASIAKIQKDYEQNKSELGALAVEYEDLPMDVLEQQLQDLKEEHEALQQYSTEERLKSVQVVAATLDGYIGRFLEEKLNVDHIFVDEAGYANLIKILTLFNHRVPITLLGDHMQLPPVCEINDQSIAKDEDYHAAFVWSQSAIHLESLFCHERLTALRNYVQQAPLELMHMQQANLNQTYRFGSNLAQVLETHVYQNGFEALSSFNNTEIYYANAPKPARTQRRENPAEVNAIGALLPHLETDDFAILTPYRNQLRLLGKTYPHLRQRQQLLTVHGSQGREWHTVILSIVDTHDKWFTDSQNKQSKGLYLLNTAVSRAKQRLILVGDLHYWHQQKGQLLQALTDIGKDFKRRLF